MLLLYFAKWTTALNSETYWLKKEAFSEKGLRNGYLPKALVNFKNKYHAFPIHSMPSKLVQRHILGRPLQNFPGWSGLALRSMTLCQMFCNKWCPSFHISTLFLPLLMCPHKGNQTSKWEYGNKFYKIRHIQSNRTRKRLPWTCLQNKLLFCIVQGLDIFLI